MNKQDKLKLSRARELLDYDPETGILRWKVKRQPSIKPGDEAGGISNSGRCSGYRTVSIEGNRYLVHRIAWFHFYGVWPDDLLDHVNLDKADNRITNLRHATRQQQNANKRSWSRLGLKGVDRRGSKWEARIRSNGNRLYLGLYSTPEEAHAAYVEAATRLFGEFARAA